MDTKSIDGAPLTRDSCFCMLLALQSNENLSYPKPTQLNNEHKIIERYITISILILLGIIQSSCFYLHTKPLLPELAITYNTYLPTTTRSLLTLDPTGSITANNTLLCVRNSNFIYVRNLTLFQAPLI